jgi:hypothetical protein
MYPVTTFYFCLGDDQIKHLLQPGPPGHPVPGQVILKMICDLSPTILASLLHPRAESINTDLVATLVVHIHTNQAAGAILVFHPRLRKSPTLQDYSPCPLFHLPHANVNPLNGLMSSQC